MKEFRVIFNEAHPSAGGGFEIVGPFFEIVRAHSEKSVRSQFEAHGLVVSEIEALVLL